jgi:hypothetical protein
MVKKKELIWVDVVDDSGEVRQQRRDGRHKEKNGNEKWYFNGQLHREDGPAITDFFVSEWYLKGKKHRVGGPAVEHYSGNKEWWLNGEYHREDGPAIEWPGVFKQWRLNGKLHREDGPAVENVDFANVWYLDGEKYTEQEFNSIQEKKKLNLELAQSLPTNKVKPTKKVKI